MRKKREPKSSPTGTTFQKERGGRRQNYGSQALSSSRTARGRNSRSASLSLKRKKGNFTKNRKGLPLGPANARRIADLGRDHEYPRWKRKRDQSDKGIGKKRTASSSRRVWMSGPWSVLRGLNIEFSLEDNVTAFSLLPSQISLKRQHHNGRQPPLIGKEGLQAVHDRVYFLTRDGEGFKRDPAGQCRVLAVPIGWNRTGASA